jgi:uncharacterized protein YdeI (YjbR/CyaY-like superfamily)
LESDPINQAVFFESPAHFRRWLEEHHGSIAVLWIAFWKAHTGKKGLTYEEAVEESLCFGWIDGLVKRRDAESYQQRFTPRKATSIWSTVNVRKVEALQNAGRMARPGLEAFAKRDHRRSGSYSFENRHVKLSAEFEKRFRAKKAAWRFFEAQPPGYRRVAGFWVMSAKKEETRERRFAQLVEGSQAGKRLPAISGEKSPSR